MNLYVGNLSYSITEDRLTEIFNEFGGVTSAKIITDKFTGKSKGFGFVDMDSDSSGQAAIDALNGKDIDGRQMTVNKARPREERPSFSKNRY